MHESGFDTDRVHVTYIFSQGGGGEDYYQKIVNTLFLVFYNIFFPYIKYSEQNELSIFFYNIPLGH